MIASGASTLAHVMSDIDQAYANGTLTPMQASSLLVDIAAHGNGNLAVQVAAGAEFAKVVSACTAAGIPVFPGVAASPDYYASAAVSTVVGLGTGGYLGTGHPNMMTATLNAEGIAAFLAGGLGSNAISEITRTAFELVMQTAIVGGYYSGVFYNMSAPPPPMIGLGLAQVFNDIAAAHAMPGPELIRAVFVTPSAQYFNTGQELQTLILNHSVSMAEVNTAITSAGGRPTMPCRC